MPAAALAAIVDAAAPGGRVTGVRRLHGGVSEITHLVRLAGAAGERRAVVVRRYQTASMQRWPDAPARMWRTLTALAAANTGVRAPRPVLFDESGARFGAPAVVMTREPGRAGLRPRDPERWLRDLAEAVVPLHQTPITPALAFLNRPRDWPAVPLAVAHANQLARHPLGEVIRAVFQRHSAAMARLPLCLIHGDYWAGNTLWRRGRLSAIVDWEQAALSTPGEEIGYCRMDLALQRSETDADAFGRAYEQAAGSTVPFLPVWDLAGAMRVPGELELWLPGFQALGLTHLTVEECKQRLFTFTERALYRAQQLDGG